MSLDDTMRRFKEQMPHAKIRNIDVMDPVKQAAKQTDPGWLRKMADERKRSLDEVGHVSKVSHRERKLASLSASSQSDCRWVPVCMKCCLAEELGGKAHVLMPLDVLRERFFRDTDTYCYGFKYNDFGELEIVRHKGMVGSPTHEETRMELTDAMYEAAIPGPEPEGKRHPCVKCGKPTANQRMRGDAEKVEGAKRGRKNGSKMREANGEIISESLVPPPERGCDHIAEQWRKDGRLQVRNMNGVPTEVCVFSSRKQHDDSIREFNRNSPEVKLRNRHVGERADGANGRYRDR